MEALIGFQYTKQLLTRLSFERMKRLSIESEIFCPREGIDGGVLVARYLPGARQVKITARARRIRQRFRQVGNGQIVRPFCGVFPAPIPEEEGVVRFEPDRRRVVGGFRPVGGLPIGRYLLGLR